MNRIGYWRFIIQLMLVFSLFLLPACRPEEIVPEPEPEPEPARETIVHVVGWGDAANGAFPCYWKDGQFVDLNVCRYSGPVRAEGYVHAIFVSGNDVYAGGWVSCKYQRVASFWKNGVRTDIRRPNASSYANSIFVSGADVYLAGWTFFHGIYIPCYWKNGVRFDLSQLGPNVSAQANSIFVSENDVFVAGTSFANAGKNQYPEVPCYWKNGELIELSRFDAEHSGNGNAIVVSEGNVYVAGDAGDQTSLGVPCYWLNGVRTDLSKLDKNATGWGNSIHVSGSDVYVGGVTQNGACELIPCYWKNGKRTDLSMVNPALGGWVSSIFVLGRDVFVAGHNGFDPNLGANSPVPCYWKNGLRTDLSPGTYPGAFATAISATYK